MALTKIQQTQTAFLPSGTGATVRTADSKFEDTVSVKDFGAVGDNTTDDTAAIQAAFNSVSTFSSVYFPPGQYLLSSNITATSKRAILNSATFSGNYKILADVIESYDSYINRKGSNIAVGTPAPNIGNDLPYNKGGLLIGAGHSTNNTGSWISCDGATNWLTVIPSKNLNPQELIIYNSGLSGYANAVEGGGVINKVSGANFPAPYDSTNKLIGDQFYFLRKVFKIKAINSASQLEVQEEDLSPVTFDAADAAQTEAYTYCLTTGTGTATVTGTSVKYVSGDPFVPTFFHRGFKFSLTGKTTEFNITQANITEANPGVFTSNGHGLQNGDSLKYTVNGTQPLVTSAGSTADNTVFYVVNKTDNTFQLATSSGGTALQVTNDGSDGQVFSINVTFVDHDEYTLGSAVGNGTYNFEWKGNINDQLSTLRVQAIAGDNEENVNLMAYGGNNFLGRYYSLEAGFAGIGKFRPLYIGSGDYSNNAGYAHNIGCHPRSSFSSKPVLQLGGVQGRHSLTVFGPTDGTLFANRFELEGSPTGVTPAIRTKGTDTNINFGYDSKGTGSHNFTQDFARTLFKITGPTGAVNFLASESSTTGNPVKFYADGTDANINFSLYPKGTGGLGIGTNNPGGKLEVYSAANKATYIANGETDNPSYPAYGFAGQNADNGARGAGMYLAGDGWLAFATHGANRFSIESAGKVMIGTTTLNGAQGITLLPNHDDGALQMNWNRVDTTNTSFIQNFLNNGVSSGYIAYTNTATVFGTSSDYRLKENVVAISDGITRLKTLKPYRFNFKADPTKTVDGFFAHEVTAVPEAITGTKDGMKDILYIESDTIPSGKSVGDIKETVPDYQGIDQSKLVPLLTAALQEEIAKREALEIRVGALEAT